MQMKYGDLPFPGATTVPCGVLYNCRPEEESHDRNLHPIPSTITTNTRKLKTLSSWSLPRGFPRLLYEINDIVENRARVYLGLETEFLETCGELRYFTAENVADNQIRIFSNTK